MTIPNLRDPFEVFLFAALAEYTATQLPPGVKLSVRLWQEQVARAHEAWHAARKPKRKKRGGAMTEEEWIASLKVDPFLAGVAVDTEIAKCQFHFRHLAHPVIPSRKRIANWLKNADRTVAPRAVSPGETEPLGWLEWMRKNRPDWRRFREEREGHPVPEWNKLPKDDRTIILAEMKKTP